ncbi:MAG: 4-hydroxy-tetrahydrodipicolinate reductase [Methanomicrobia archaeon]|nr:4-hydroxy-tetrahydrodipicolinate reductase [Methanomicrobia archaeon]
MAIRVVVAGAKGRTGSHIVQGVLAHADMELVGGVDPQGVGEVLGSGVRVTSPNELGNLLKEAKPQVLVDFTNAAAAVENVKIAAQQNVKLVVGTTGFSAEQFKELETAITGHVSAIISPNFSIGVNVFWNLIAEAARQLHTYQYHMEVIELHHAHKKDAPSGTALKAAELLAAYLPAADRRFVYGRQGMTGERTQEEIGIHAIRAGEIVGEHTVLYAGNGERLEITHRAQSRDAFALGALTAIAWIHGKAECRIFSMAEMLRELEVA